MLFEQWSSLMDELKIEVLTKLINAKTFPHTLLQASSTHWKMRGLVQDFSIWQKALHDYFPFKERADPQQYRTTFLEIFKECYVACKTILADKNVSMSDYIEVVMNDWGNIPEEKKDVLIGLGLVVGFEHKFDKKDISILAQSYAMLFATALGLKSQLVPFVGLNQPAIAPSFIRRGLQLAAEFGHVPIFVYYLSHAPARLDASSRRSALIKAAKNGQLKIIKVIVQTPNYLNGETHALRNAVHIAAKNGHAAIVQALIGKMRLLSENLTMRTALKLACEKKHADVVSVILQDASAQIDTYTTIDLFKQAAKSGNVNIVALFFKHSNKSLSTPTVLEVLRQTMNQANEQVILLILENRHSQFSIFIKRQLLMMASSNGYESIIRFLVDNENTAIGNTALKQASKLALAQGYPHLEQLLQRCQYHESDMLSISHKIADLSLEADFVAFTPKFQSSRISKEGDNLPYTTNTRLRSCTFLR